MKIVHAIAGLGRAAGTSVFCAELCGQFAAEGDAGRIVLPTAPAGDRHPTAADVTVAAFMPRLASPDVLHVHALWHPFLHRVMAWGLDRGVPVVVSPHGMLTPWALHHRRWKKWLALLAYQRRDLLAASMLHATSESEVDDIRRLGLRQPVAVVPLGVEIPVASDPAGLAGRAGGGTRTVLFVSRVHPKKGLVNLLRAWSALRREEPGLRDGATPRWRLVIAGPDEGGHRAELEALATGLGLSVGDCPSAAVGGAAWTADVTFTGAVHEAEKAALYRRADLFVLPSHSENFGVVVPEALAAGLPVITTKGTPWQELEHVPAADDGDRGGRAGWWIDIGVEPLVRSLREAVRASDSERAAMGVHGLRLVRLRYGWPHVAGEMRAAYGWLVDGGRVPGCVRLAGPALPRQARGSAASSASTGGNQTAS